MADNSLCSMEGIFCDLTHNSIFFFILNTDSFIGWRSGKALASHRLPHEDHPNANIGANEHD